MFIALHIVIALTSLIMATVSVVKPSRITLRVNYGLIVATLASGVAMVITTHSPLVSSCVSGLSYLAVAAILLALAEGRLARIDK